MFRLEGCAAQRIDGGRLAVEMPLQLSRKMEHLRIRREQEYHEQKGVESDTEPGGTAYEALYRFALPYHPGEQRWQAPADDDGQHIHDGKQKPFFFVRDKTMQHDKADYRIHQRMPVPGEQCASKTAKK